jgi:hypothetical protein
MSFSINDTVSINDSQHNNILHQVPLYSVSLFAECRYAECRGVLQILDQTVEVFQGQTTLFVRSISDKDKNYIVMIPEAYTIKLFTTVIVV